MTDFSNIDEQFRDEQKNWEGQPGDAAWNRLSDRLDDYRSTRVVRRRRIYRISAAASVAALLTVSIYMFNQSFEASGFHAQQTDMEVPDHEGVQTGAITKGKPEVSLSDMKEGYEELDVMESKTMRTATDEIDNRNDFRRDRSIAAAPAAASEAISMEEFQADDINSEASGILSEIVVRADPEKVSGGTGSGDGYQQAGIVKSGGEDDLDEMVIFEDATEQITDEGLPELTEVAVANMIGTEAKKAEQQARDNRSNPKRTDSGTSAAYQSDQDRTIMEVYAEPAAEEVDRKDEFTSTSVIVLIPAGDNSDCRYTAFQVERELYYIDRCQNDKFDLLRTESLPIERAPVLHDLMQYDREYLQSLEAKAKTGPCLPSGNSVLFVFRTGTALSYHEETIRLPMQEFCLPEEAKGIVRKLKELQQRYAD